MDAALSNKLVSLATQCDARCKRQASACAVTQASIVELESKIAEISKDQDDLFKQENSTPASSRKRV